jgi:hypothetical protein
VVSELKQFALGMIVLGILFVYFALTGFMPDSSLSDLILFFYLPLIGGIALFA